MRRDSIEIIDEILALLEKSHCAMSVNAIAQQTGLHNITVKRYVEIIERVKGEHIEIIRTTRSVILRVNDKD